MIDRSDWLLRITTVRRLGRIDYRDMSPKMTPNVQQLLTIKSSHLSISTAHTPSLLHGIGR